ncbi:aldo/keto reductase [Streptantibioticus silvisoli]|uniref:Aldo/keto reductase n=1 Tax=Streptantibioticus silvisoli TaxID=2705255 RepID=A0ABT6W4N7_9ACTN|nr:aldo/keto reductase [Streptantibioticus silvisoli]MDI5965686.1 aldo/keto reductase [Streptantibioticus silvisoli]
MSRIGNSDLDVFPLSLGGNVFGWTADERESFAVLDAFVAAGGDFIDTADVYSAWIPGNSGGESEAIIGRWMAARGNRDQLVVATKIGSFPAFPGLSAANIKAGVEESLRRLGTDRIDLYYTHKDDTTVPVEEFLGALDELVKAGKVRAIGASNISAERLTEALEASDREGLAKYVALQPHYNLVERGHYEGEVASVVAAHGLSVMPYFALASGFLTGKYRPGTTVDSARAGSAAAYLKDERNVRVLSALDEVAQAHDAEVATVALAWLAAQPHIAAPIASARTVAQLPALMAVGGLKLSDDELTRLSTAGA